jgi:hypothetical protein
MPEFLHRFLDKEISVDHPDRVYADCLWNMTIFLAVGCPLVSYGYLPGAIYVVFMNAVFLGRFTLLLHYTTHLANSPSITWYI